MAKNDLVSIACALAAISALVTIPLYARSDELADLRLINPGVDVDPVVISIAPECVPSKVGGPFEYRSIVVDVLCVTGGSQESNKGLTGVKLQVFGIKKKTQDSKVTTNGQTGRSELGEVGLDERLIPNFPLVKYTATSRYMDGEGNFFERSDGAQYFATYDIAVTLPDGTLPRELECQSIWVRTQGAKDFSLELSKCTSLFELAGLKAFVILDLTDGASSEALRQVLDTFVARIRIQKP